MIFCTLYWSFFIIFSSIGFRKVLCCGLIQLTSVFRFVLVLKPLAISVKLASHASDINFDFSFNPAESASGRGEDGCRSHRLYMGITCDAKLSNPAPPPSCSYPLHVPSAFWTHVRRSRIGSPLDSANLWCRPWKELQTVCDVHVYWMDEAGVSVGRSLNRIPFMGLSFSFSVYVTHNETFLTVSVTP